ncbi:TRAP transporter small permease [Oceanibacterium hippocampi]|uniref:TRAP transporter small permease protein n=1 Tax=Oceanibacterium hippocampi TaxID=745714 RepID=A0A1Y5TRW7_9PROT|nr:TRAP transporter small permease [Oceanibacterium hippocampi]SLN66788.1 Tripartite ATP-independent periplasmic transporters, DctQ component [Oceanibacterium hippocampi]
MGFLNYLGRTTDRLNALGAIVAGAGLAAMMLIGAFDVLGSSLLGKPVPGAYELTETIMVGSVFLALALAQSQGSHIRVDAIVKTMSARPRHVSETVAHFCSVLFYLGICVFGWDGFLQSIDEAAVYQGLIGLPVWPGRLALAVGASMVVVQAARDGLRSASRCWR